MVVVNVVISGDGKVSEAGTSQYHMECNLLKREDANDSEWAMAKLIEKTVEAVMVIASKEILSMQKIV